MRSAIWWAKVMARSPPVSGGQRHEVVDGLQCIDRAREADATLGGVRGQPRGQAVAQLHTVRLVADRWLTPHSGWPVASCFQHAAVLEVDPQTDMHGFEPRG